MDYFSDAYEEKMIIAGFTNSSIQIVSQFSVKSKTIEASFGSGKGCIGKIEFSPGFKRGDIFW